MAHLLIMAFAAALGTTASAADLYANRITGLDTSRGRQYTVTYTSSIRPVVLWGDATQYIYYNNNPDYVITSSYSNGQGVSTVIKPEAGDGIMFSLSINDSFIYYYFPDFIGEKELPEVELESVNGDVLDYTHNVPLSYGMKYSNLPSGYPPGNLFFFFKYINSTENPVLQTVTSFDPHPRGVFTSPKTNITGNYTVMSGDVNMGSMEGINIVLLYYGGVEQNMAIYKGLTIAVKQKEDESPFPDGFIGLSTTLEGSNTPDCRGSVCRFYCDAYGNDIVDVQVHMKDNDEIVEPLFKFMNKWYMTAGYQTQPEDYGQTFVCKARNAQAQTAELDVKLAKEE